MKKDTVDESYCAYCERPLNAENDDGSWHCGIYPAKVGVCCPECHAKRKNNPPIMVISTIPPAYRPTNKPTRGE